jgi:transcriptional regulator with XRE-family HTH domain
MAIHPERIFQRRKQLGMSQEELAGRIGTSQRQISKYETGKNDPTAEVLNSLADALDTTTDWLLGRTDIPERSLRGVGDLSEDEAEIIRILRKNFNQRDIIMNIVKQFAKI